MQAVQAGEADIAYSLDPDNAQSVEDDENLQLISGPSLAIEYLAMHTQEDPGGPVSNKLVRQAIGHAIDYDGIVNDLMQGAAIQPTMMRRSRCLPQSRFRTSNTRPTSRVRRGFLMSRASAR